VRDLFIDSQPCELAIRELSDRRYMDTNHWREYEIT
jgi:hypothetical protein